ncbi:phospholipase D family protein [Methanobacterium formicicum]|jgi:sugar-specific transcriptional regulator TrmB|uniref:phospholipase D family protein n=1 Tax=Methanobacterium formicicum TaxID=2162 RepID=UPI0024901BB0|nr:phospholipase D family protein [Methanobacterium formicicum]
MDFSKEDLELIEKIRVYRTDKKLIETLSLENHTLKEKNKEIQEALVPLKKEFLDRDKLISQINDLKLEIKGLKKELTEFKGKYKFVVTTSDSVSTVYSEIRKNLSGAKKEVLVCSPWITYLVNEFEGFPPGITLKIITNFRKEDVERGITDVDKLRALQELGAKIRYNNNLHAKMVFIDGEIAIISSANLTKRGLSVNYEAGAVIKDQAKVTEAVEFFNSVWDESETLTSELIRNYAQVTK